MRPVQSDRLWNMRQLPGGRAKGHKGTKPRDWRQRTRALRDRAEEVCELARDPAPPPSSNFSWETSSAVSEVTTENLASSLKELEAQHAKMTDATTKLLSVVSEAGGRPWIYSPGLKEDLLTEWLGVQ